MSEVFASNMSRYIKADYPFCPYCDGNELRADDLRDEGYYAWRKVACNTCKKSWNEILNIVSIEERS